MNGWIKLHRSLLEWEWYDDHNARMLLIHLLVSVNYEEKKWKGVTIKPGSMAFSWKTLAKGVGITVKQCRVAMKKLEKTGQRKGSEVVIERAGSFQVVTLVKWDKLQSLEKERAEKGQANGPKEGGERATTKEIKNKEVEERDAVSNPDDEFYEPSEHECIMFFQQKGFNEKKARKFFSHYSKHKWNDILGRPVKYWKDTAIEWFDENSKVQSPLSEERKREIMAKPKTALSKAEWDELDYGGQKYYAMTNSGNPYPFKQ